MNRTLRKALAAWMLVIASAAAGSASTWNDADCYAADAPAERATAA